MSSSVSSIDASVRMIAHSPINSAAFNAPMEKQKPMARHTRMARMVFFRYLVMLDHLVEVMPALRPDDVEDEVGEP